MDYLTTIIKNSRSIATENPDELVPFIGYMIFTSSYNIQADYLSLAPFFSIITYYEDGVGAHPADVLDDVIGKVWEHTVAKDALGLGQYSLANLQLETYYSAYQQRTISIPYAIFTLRNSYTVYERGNYVMRSKMLGQVRVNQIYPEDAWLPKG